jgi:hypothetical protein
MMIFNWEVGSNLVGGVWAQYFSLLFVQILDILVGEDVPAS